MPFDASSEVQKLNQWLKESAIPVGVKLDGRALALQATLPCKPGQGTGKKQQKIYLGIRANADGVKRIKSEAQHLGHLITMGKFSWDLYLPDEKITPGIRTVADVIAGFREEYQRSHRIKEATWRETWQRTFDRLPQSEPITEAAILAVILMTAPHTRNRELFCQRLQQLANYAGLAIDLSTYKGGYNASETKPRRIPGKTEIIEWRDRIPNPSWQWVYGILAAFGLRPHEAFFCEFNLDDRYGLKVLEGKTGERQVMAAHPDWVDEWDLPTIDLPPVKGRSYRDYGQRTNRQFERYEVPFNAYDLRHAVAIELSVVRRMPVSVAASFLGHSASVHTNTYHRWLSADTNKQVWQDIMQIDDENKQTAPIGSEEHDIPT